MHLQLRDKFEGLAGINSPEALCCLVMFLCFVIRCGNALQSLLRCSITHNTQFIDFKASRDHYVNQNRSPCIELLICTIQTS